MIKNENKTERLWVRATKEQKKEIKSLAKEKGLSMSDFVLCKALGLVPDFREEIVTYTSGKHKQKRVKSSVHLIKPPSL
jgi:hypothetical protein